MSDFAPQKRHEDILKLISLYKEHQCLWDATYGGNIHERRVAFDEIAKKMNYSTHDVKSKMKNLRAQFRREVVRMQRLNTKRAKWLYYEPLKFLKTSLDYYDENMRKSQLRIKRGRSELSNSDLEYEDEYSTIDDNAITSNDDESQQHDTNEELLLNISRDGNHTESEAETISKSKNFDDKRKSKKRIVVITRPRSEERDEFTIFGEHVANELRQLENHKSLQQSLKCSILQSILNVNQANINYPTEEVYGEEAYLEEYI